MAAYADKYWWSQDNLRLHYRDYPGRDDRPPILCIPGLTRNVRDFDGLADRLAGDWRLIVVELRGRGESAYAKDPMTYVPLVYLQDLVALIDELAVPRFIGIGTSLGGIMLMLLATARGQQMAGALLNDIGPDLAPAGLERIKAHIGTSGPQPTWVHAARAVADVQRVIYPDWKLQDWLRFAKKLYRLSSQGRMVLDYDQRISEPLRVPGGEAGVSLWPVFEAMAAIPLVLVRGERSDLLSPETVAQMQARHPGMEVFSVPRVGHAPTLDEPPAIAGIDRLLELALDRVPAES